MTTLAELMPFLHEQPKAKKKRLPAQQRTRRDHSLWDKAINEKWNGQRPILSPEESLTAAKKLYRHAMGKAWKGDWKLTSGNRHTWPASRVFYVNPDRPWGERGLRGIIHSISHYCHRRLYPQDKPHSIRQLRLEAKLTRFALDRRWHEGTLKKQPKPEPAVTQSESPAPAPAALPDRIVLRYRRMKARRDKWEHELERAKRLLTKAEREVRTYERRHKDRLFAQA